MNFSQLQCLVALAETGSFTEAAYAINLTQSAVSHALAALENELGVTLLERNRKGVVALSDAGQKVIPHARLLLRQMEAIEQEARTARGQAAGKVRLGSMPAVCPGLLAGLLTRFQELYPEIEVVLFEGTIQDVQEWIENSIVDVGFVLHPTPNIASTLIITDERCVFVPYGHRLHTRTTVKIDELQEERFVMPKSSCEFLGMAGLMLNKNRPHIRYQANDGATLLAMVREGLGITFLPRMMLPAKLEGVVAIPLDPPQPTPIGLGVRSQETTSPGVKLLVETALTLVRQQKIPTRAFA